MNKSDTIAKFATAFCQAQAEIESASKKCKNPFFKSRYADLSEVIDSVRAPLNKFGISFMQLVDSKESGLFVKTILLHESGEFISSETPVLCQKQNDPQAMGSGITYSKRYALQAICGLPTDDDDAESAMSREPVKASKTNTKHLLDLIEKLNKDDEAIKQMISWAGGKKGDTLETLSSSAQYKIILALEKQLK